MIPRLVTMYLVNIASVDNKCFILRTLRISFAFQSLKKGYTLSIFHGNPSKLKLLYWFFSINFLLVQCPAVPELSVMIYLQSG